MTFKKLLNTHVDGRLIDWRHPGLGIAEDNLIEFPGPLVEPLGLILISLHDWPERCVSAIGSGLSVR